MLLKRPTPIRHFLPIIGDTLLSFIIRPFSIANYIDFYFVRTFKKIMILFIILGNSLMQLLFARLNICFTRFFKID